MPFNISVGTIKEHQAPRFRTMIMNNKLYANTTELHGKLFLENLKVST